MDVAGISEEAAGIALLKAANKQPELALDLLNKTLENIPGAAPQASQAAEVPRSAEQGANIDILA